MPVAVFGPCYHQPASWLGPPIPMLFGNTAVSVFKKGNNGIPVLIPVFCSVMLLMRKFQSDWQKTGSKQL